VGVRRARPGAHPGAHTAPPPQTVGQTQPNNRAEHTQVTWAHEGDRCVAVQAQAGTREALTVAKTVALLRQLNQLTVRTATVCQGLFDDAAAVSGRVGALTDRIRAAEGAAADLESKRASGVRPVQELEYGGAEPDLEFPDPEPSLPRMDWPSHGDAQTALAQSPAWARTTQHALSQCRSEPVLECPQNFSNPSALPPRLRALPPRFMSRAPGCV